MKKAEKVAVILNNLGGTSKLEELILAREVVTQLEGRGFRVVRMYAGHMMTSLEMSGFLISLLKVTEFPEWLELLDAPTSAPAWPVNFMSEKSDDRFNPEPIEPSPLKVLLPFLYVQYSAHDVSVFLLRYYS